MSNSKSAGDPCYPNPPSIPKVSVANFTGAQALVYATHQQGDLPENLDGMRSSHVTVRFSRAKSAPDALFDIAIGIGREVIVRMTTDEFVEAFMAVVPRWFWKPKDER